MSLLRPAFVLLLLLTLITGGLYPLLVTGVSQLVFTRQANGSLILENQRPVGSRLIALAPGGAGDFVPRPSASGDSPWNPALSGGSNLAASNPALDKQIAARVAALRAANPQASNRVPVELVTASGSGLDPNLTPDAARWQIPRIARVRGISTDTLQRLVTQQTERPWPPFIGQPVVNVITLNRALDALSPPPSR